MPLTESQSRDIDRVVDILRESHSLLFITGAGMSADSGLPTYRGIGGLYNVNRTEEGMPIEINPGTSQVSHLVDIKLDLGAAVALDEIWRRYRADG